MRLIFCLTICLMQIFLSDAANRGKYTVIAPGRIYSNEIYTAAVAVHHTNQPCKINVSINGPSYSETQQVEVSQYQVKTVDFFVPTLDRGIYNLTAEGVDCLDNFRNTTTLAVVVQKYDAVIQTDRGLYRPGDQVQYRVLFMDKDLRPPEELENVTISISDGNKRVVENIQDIKTVTGVYTNRFMIPEGSAAGEWSLGVLHRGDFATLAHFVVEDKYLVELDATEAVSIYDGHLQVFVTANHVCGETVNGNATITVTLNEGYQFQIQPPPALTKTAKMVNGTAQFLFNVTEHYLKYTNDRKTEMNIMAKVVEDDTNVTVTKSIVRYIYFYRYTLSCTRIVDGVNEESCFTFDGNKENIMAFQLMHLNRSFVRGSNNEVKLSFKEVLGRNFRYGLPPATHPESKNQTVTFYGRMNATGFVTFSEYLHELPEYEDYFHYYEVSYEYMGEERVIFDSYEKIKPKKYFTLADQSLARPKMFFNDDYTLTVRSSERFPYLNYIIVGNRNIMQAGTVKLSNKPKVYNLEITPQRWWGEKFRVYVYYVDEHGEYHYDEKRYQVTVLRKPLIIPQSQSVMAGQNASITILASPKSIVSLTAVDKRMLLRKRNNDVTSAQLDKVFNNFATFVKRPFGYSRYPGAIAGCATLTNANYFYDFEYIREKSNIGKTTYGLAPRQNKQHVAVPSSSAGQDMCLTLAFENFERSRTGEIVFSKKVPDIETTWVFTAFSVKRSHGFSVTGEAIEITVSK